MRPDLGRFTAAKPPVCGQSSTSKQDRSPFAFLVSKTRLIDSKQPPFNRRTGCPDFRSPPSPNPAHLPSTSAPAEGQPVHLSHGFPM